MVPEVMVEPETFPAVVIPLLLIFASVMLPSVMLVVRVPTNIVFTTCQCNFEE